VARLTWSVAGTRFFEMGVDRGVLFVGINPGVAWTGLISVAESPTGGEPKPFYMDGIKYLNLASAEEFAATINAFTSPAEFGPCDGTVSIQNGLFITQQPRKSFGLSYRTKLGNEIDGIDYAYKIHLVYNAYAAPSDRPNSTITGSPEPSNFSWAITTLPPTLSGYKPTAHFVIESHLTPTEVLLEIEDILYGTDAVASSLPSATDLVVMFMRPYNDFQFTTLPVTSGGPSMSVDSTYDSGTPTDTYTTTIDGGVP
jgi:hypothetical protein